MASATAGFDPDVEVPAGNEDATPQHVLDLPQLYRKPSAQTLLSALTLLTRAPPSWASNTTNLSLIDEDGIPSYLTRIISSSLSWLPSDTAREQVWEAASTRLAERSGRTAMPDVSRTFTIPIDPRDSSSDTIDIELHEPSLTGDNLGHKTWVASYLLAKQLPTLLPRHFPGLEPPSSSSSSSSSSKAYTPSPRPTTPSRPLRVLELGAGTGLVGLAASALFRTSTHLTDLAPIIPNLRRNIAHNAALTSRSEVTAAPLDWSDPTSYFCGPCLDNIHGRDYNNGNNNDDEEVQEPESKETKYNLILASDPLYAPQHAEWLVDAISALLVPPPPSPPKTLPKNLPPPQNQEEARVIIELPLRSASEEPPAEHLDLRRRMRAKGFVILDEGVEEGWDDWMEKSRAGKGEGEGGQVGVRCWWGVWGWE